MYFADHAPPHFHVITVSNERISVTIETLVSQAGDADRRDTAEAMEWLVRIARSFARGGGSIRNRRRRRRIFVDRSPREKS
jgi:hypothetical protein